MPSGPELPAELQRTSPRAASPSPPGPRQLSMVLKRSLRSPAAPPPRPPPEGPSAQDCTPWAFSRTSVVSLQLRSSSPSEALLLGPGLWLDLAWNRHSCRESGLLALRLLTAAELLPISDPPSPPPCDGHRESKAAQGPRRTTGDSEHMAHRPALGHTPRTSGTKPVIALDKAPSPSESNLSSAVTCFVTLDSCCGLGYLW